ncbi:MAG TPA: hypothetical protein VH231_03160 [Solirubrobacteraceae bacterium]|nr:hypothetical protein [Solirubrobacteraceae bacterium]
MTGMCFWPQDDAGQRLGLEVAQLLELELREPAHLVLGERDVVAQLGVQRLGRRGDLVVADDERRRVPGVEAL